MQLSPSERPEAILLLRKVPLINYSGRTNRESFRKIGFDCIQNLANLV